MKKYLISYDLKVPGKDYDALYKVLKSASSWWHYLDSTWLIYTNDSVDTWQNRIKTSIDNNDYFIIVHFDSQSYSGWLPKDAWNWITQHPEN